MKTFTAYYKDTDKNKIIEFYSSNDKDEVMNWVMNKLYTDLGNGGMSAKRHSDGSVGSLWRCADEIYDVLESGGHYGYCDRDFWVAGPDYTLMTEREMLEELADRVVKYDELRDKRKAMLDETIDQKGEWSPDALTDYDNLCMEVDEAFCRVREIIRIVKKDPKFWAC